jgi:hypothetical protein
MLAETKNPYFMNGAKNGGRTGERDGNSDSAIAKYR